jgi:hypothetical protein
MSIPIQVDDLELDDSLHNNVSHPAAEDPSNCDHRVKNNDDGSQDDSILLDTLNDDSDGFFGTTDVAKRDTKRVLHLKVLVILFLILSATIISVVVYTYITQSEQKQFQAKCSSDAEKVHSAISTSIQRSLGVLNTIAVILVSYASDKGLEWPFVALPDFALHASKMLPATDGLYVSVVPIVTPAQKIQWEDFAFRNDIWVNQSLALQEVWDGYQGEIMKDWERSHKVYGSFGDIESNVTYVPHPLHVGAIYRQRLFYGCCPVIFSNSHINDPFYSIITVDICYQNGKVFHWVRYR